MKPSKREKLIRSFPPHFDSVLTMSEGQALASDSVRVQKHAFYPFIHYEKRWTKFAKKGSKGKEKSRLIRYAARRDAEIFSYYREILRKIYDQKLAASGISDSVIGYRRVLGVNGKGKCNIHFAKEAFDTVKAFGDCFVYALDISQFFENLDHAKLKSKWADALGVVRLPPDHFQVYQAITRYSWVDREEVYEALGLIGPATHNGKIVKKLLVSRHDIKPQLCNPAEFREKIAPLIKTNKSGCGVPQGAPISDLLSNLYLFDFDRDLYAWSKSHGGRYFRYSDDILIILPSTHDEWDSVINHVKHQVSVSGSKLEINPAKCSAYRFTKDDGGQQCELIHENGCKNGIEYLGFRYDGRNIFLRESTLAKLNRAIKKACRSAAREHTHHNPHQTPAELLETFNVNRIYTKVGRVIDFAEKKSYRDWTFWTYVRRCQEILGQDSRSVLKQVRSYRRRIRHTFAAELNLISPSF